VKYLNDLKHFAYISVIKHLSVWGNIIKCFSDLFNDGMFCHKMLEEKMCFIFIKNVFLILSVLEIMKWMISRCMQNVLGHLNISLSSKIYVNFVQWWWPSWISE
jgi:hypothetical protein